MTLGSLFQSHASEYYRVSTAGPLHYPTPETGGPVFGRSTVCDKYVDETRNGEQISDEAWCAEEQEQKYPARPRCCHPRGQCPIRGTRPFRLEVERRGEPVDGSWQDMLPSPRI
ncbi:hypothetical protein AB3S75_031499 [Citrus x aurantiifolia]